MAHEDEKRKEESYVFKELINALGLEIKNDIHGDAPDFQFETNGKRVAMDVQDVMVSQEDQDEWVNLKDEGTSDGRSFNKETLKERLEKSLEKKMNKDYKAHGINQVWLGNYFLKISFGKLWSVFFTETELIEIVKSKMRNAKGPFDRVIFFDVPSKAIIVDAILDNHSLLKF